MGGLKAFLFFSGLGKKREDVSLFNELRIPIPFRGDLLNRFYNFSGDSSDYSIRRDISIDHRTGGDY